MTADFPGGFSDVGLLVKMAVSVHEKSSVYPLCVAEKFEIFSTNVSPDTTGICALFFLSLALAHIIESRPFAPVVPEVAE